MNELREFIQEKRPTLSASSLTTYTSILKNLYSKVFSNDEPMDFTRFDDNVKILEFLHNIPANRRKVILSALVVVSPEIKAYRDAMLSDIKAYNEDIAKQEKTPQQQANWVEADTIDTIWNTLSKNANLLYKKDQLNSNDLQHIQNFVLLSLLSGKFCPVRRSKDYVDFKIKNIDKTKDNFLEKNHLVFNSYKTAKTYGQQRIPIPIQLRNILTKWIKHNPTDTLFFDTNNNPLTAVKINQRLNKIFDGKKVSVNALRHSVLTSRFANTLREVDEMTKTMNQMGSSMRQAKTYVKND